MTKKDYILLADVIAKAKISEGVETTETALRLLTLDLVERLQRDNPKFNRDKFLAACGYW